MVNRNRSKSVTLGNEVILKRIEEIKADHPAWAYLKYREDLEVNKNRVYRLLKENKLSASQTSRNRAKRTPIRSKPRTSTPNKGASI